MTLFITPQINTIPSILWDVLQAPALAKPAERYQGHLPGSGVQRHSADDAYAKHAIIMEAHESSTGCRLWLAKQGNRVLAAHPRHDAARFMALALVTGA
jgi:hypothetical protein